MDGALSAPALELAAPAPPRAAPGRASGVRAGLTGWALPAAVLLAWELLARLGVLPPGWFPAPSAVAGTVGELLRSGELWGHLGATLARVAGGFALGAAAATVIGVLCGASPGARALLDPSLQALRSVPSLAWIPLFLLWLGVQEHSRVVLIAVGAFFPVYLNLVQGILQLDPRLVEVGRVYGYRGAGLVRHVLFPATLPAYLVGLRGGLGLAWMFVVAAELLGASRGLGYLMVDGQASSRADLILASLGLFALLGKATDALVQRAARRLRENL